jgi:hypothetical protein
MFMHLSLRDKKGFVVFIYLYLSLSVAMAFLRCRNEESYFVSLCDKKNKPKGETKQSKA